MPFKVQPAFLSDINFVGQKSRKRAMFETCKSTAPDLSVCSTCELPEPSSSPAISPQLPTSAESPELDSTLMVGTSSLESSASSSVQMSSADLSPAHSTSESIASINSSIVCSSLTRTATLVVSHKEASEAEQTNFFEKINQAKRKSAILKVVMPYAETLVPVTNTEKFPKPFSELYNPSMLTADYHDLLKECERIFSTIQVT